MIRKTLTTTLLGLALPILVSCDQPATAESRVDWPPQLDERYPDLELIDQTGQTVRLSDFAGSVILVEYIGMTCSACQAFAGAHDVGSFEGVRPQVGVGSIEGYAPQYGGVSLDDPRIVFVQILLYSMSMGAPTPQDARRWAEHFGMSRADREIVLAGTQELLGKASFDLIPGFQLIDRNFMLRSDSTGHRPQDNLYTELLPRIPELLKSVSAVGLQQPSADFPAAHIRPAAGPDVAPIRSSVSSTTVEDAYRAIPHRRTVFDESAARMSAEEKRFLSALFHLVDEAIVARVRRTQWIVSNGKKGSATSRHAVVLATLGELSVPRPLESVHRLVVQAIKEQQAFLDEAGKEMPLSKQQIHRHAKVRSASSKLHQAYGELLRRFPREGAQNKQAFFDYLCALDFI